MQISEFYSETDGEFSFSRQQASRFAKEAADDFNPIHDEDAKLFCVPGDLLFSVFLDKFGLSEKMSFRFVGMVTDGVVLHFNHLDANNSQLEDGEGKVYLEITREGPVVEEKALTWNFVSSYIRFSGHNFPHILVPIMTDQGVMLNPKRPLAMYESMSFEVRNDQLNEVSLDLVDSTLDVKGKKGAICMGFDIKGGSNNVIGTGQKHMSVRGLQPVEQNVVDQMILDYQGFKDNYSKS